MKKIDFVFDIWPFFMGFNGFMMSIGWFKNEPFMLFHLSIWEYMDKAEIAEGQKGLLTIFYLQIFKFSISISYGAD